MTGNWGSKAACAGMSSELFFPGAGQSTKSGRKKCAPVARWLVHAWPTRPQPGCNTGSGGRMFATDAPVPTDAAVTR